MERLGTRYDGEFPRAGLIEGREGVQDAAPFALYVARRSNVKGGPVTA
jgi:hypothetical protein